MGIPRGSTPRSSGRLREKGQKKFKMPTRDHVLDAIQTTPGKSYEQYKPRKLINNFLKERNTYNNRDDPMEMTDDEEGFSDFIVEDEPSSFESRAKKREKKKKKEKKRKKMELLSEFSSEGMSDFIVEDEPPPSRQRRNRKTKKHTKKTDYSSESESDNKDDSSDFIEEDEESGIQQSAKKTTTRMKRMLSSSDSESDKNDGVTPSRRSSRISRQPKKKFEKPNKEKAWEHILEREPDLRETVDSDDVADFVVGDEEVEEDVSDAETDVQANVDEDGDICEKSDTEKEGNTQGDDKLDNHENGGETELSLSVGDKLIKTDEDLPRKQKDIEKETDVRNQSTPSSSVSKKTDVVEAEGQSDECESDSECKTVGRKFRSKVHQRRQVINALDSDVSESDDEKINDTFVGRKRRRTSTNLNFDEDGDDSDDDSDCGGGRKEEMIGDEEEKGETR